MTRPEEQGRAETARIIGAKFALTSAASMVAEGCTYPIDFTKTRLQLQGETGFPNGLRFFEMARRIVSTEGFLGLYSGFTPALARHLPYTGTRAIGYEHIREMIGGGDGAEAPFLRRVVAAMAAGGIGQAIASPLDLVKVRMQGDGRLVAAKRLAKPRYTGLADALVTIARKEGVAGFWVGSVPAIQRAALVNLGELTTYDYAKSAFVESMGFGRDDMRCHVLAAACSGFVASLLSTPADVAKSRIMNQKTVRGLDNRLHPLHYKGMLDCWVKTVNEEGFMALYKGFFPGWVRLAPWQLVFWITCVRQLRVLRSHLMRLRVK